MHDLHIEELDRNGYSRLGTVISPAEVSWFRNSIAKEKREDIERYGVEYLKQCYSLELIQDLGRYGGPYYELLLNPKINSIVNSALNDKAVVHSYNAIVLDSKDKSDIKGHQFHRDMPWFPGCRTSIVLMIPLVDYGPFNGSTQVVPGTHLFEAMPSEDFLRKHVLSLEGKAGEGYVIDATAWHRSGVNQSRESRPMIVLKYTLAPFKQQIDFVVSNKGLKNANPLVKQRLGWDTQVPYNQDEARDWNPSTRKFKSGQYDMTNTYLYAK